MFAERPGRLAFGITSFCIVILAAQFTTVALTLVDVAFAWLNGWRGDWFLYSPLGDSPFQGIVSSPPVEDPYRLLPVVAVVVAMVAPLILVYFWPTEQKFASLLWVHLAALTGLTFGCMAMAFDLSSFAELEKRTGIKPILWAVGTLLIALGAAIAIERRNVEMTSSLFTLDSSLKRIGWWSLRVLPGFAVLALICGLNGYTAGVWASLSVVAATLFENLVRVPRQRFYALKNPRLVGAAAILPIVTAAVVAGSIYVFGMPALTGERQVVRYVRPRKVSIVSLEQARKRAAPVIEIRWATPPKR